MDTCDGDRDNGFMLIDTGGSMEPQAQLRDVLQRELLRRQSHNSSYSLRSFARHLQVQPAALSEILRGKRLVGRRLAERLFQRIPLDDGVAEEILGRIRVRRRPGSDISLPPRDTVQVESQTHWLH